ncbi:MAG: phosphoribosylglycinamide synthetase C domain-containing protein, partial [Myxococcota bacterium]
RFGDPETQPLMRRMDGDLVPLLVGAAEGRLDPSVEIGWSGAAVCVVMASAGYPRAYAKGHPIAGLEEAEADEQVVVFHAGTRPAQEGSGYETSGGRVLGVTASGQTVKAARDRAYEAVRQIDFEGAQIRRDIAVRALARG